MVKHCNWPSFWTRPFTKLQPPHTPTPGCIPPPLRRWVGTKYPGLCSRHLSDARHASKGWNQAVKNVTNPMRIEALRGGGAWGAECESLWPKNKNCSEIRNVKISSYRGWNQSRAGKPLAEGHVRIPMPWKQDSLPHTLTKHANSGHIEVWVGWTWFPLSLKVPYWKSYTNDSPLIFYLQILFSQIVFVPFQLGQPS